MEDVYDQHDKNTCSSSTSPPSSSSSPQDEISLFLHQIMLRSLSSSSSLMTHVGRNAQNSVAGGLGSSNTAHENANPLYGSSLFQDGISAVESAAVVVSTSAGGFMSSSATMKGSTAANVSSSSVGVSENETDEYDCESEEGADALAEEVPAKSVPHRSSSKRSRAAEVHNLSEKRRRSRINEKMKALQNLIPNSNKTDKASMLDEAIEYLKQLQLQVQMLSMRNGLSLHPMCFPDGLQPLQLPRMRMEFGEENRSMPLNMTATLPLHQENPLNYASSLPSKHTAPDQPSLPSPPYIINSDTSFGLDSSILTHLRPFQLGRSSEICRNDMLQHQQLNASHSDENPLGGCQELGSGTMATASLSFDMQTSELKDNSHLETCIAGTGKDETGVVLRNSEHNVILASQLSSFSPDCRLEKLPATTTSRQRNQVSEACQASNSNTF